MTNDDRPEASSLPSAQPSRPAHLSGEALKQWYLDNPPLSEEDQQRAIKVQRDRQEATAWVWLMLVAMLVALCHATAPFSPPAFFLGPIAASVIGVWLAIGRSNLLVRSLIALVVVISLGWAFIFYRSMLMASTLCAVTLSYAALCLMTWSFHKSTRRLRFTILDIGGVILLVGCGLGVIQVDPYHTMTNLEWRQFQRGMQFALVFSGNTVLASLPMMVSKRERSGNLLKVSAVLVLLVTPVIELFFLLPRLYGTPLATICFLCVMHAVGAAIVWSLVFPLEVVGAFRDEEDPLVATTEAASDTWGELE